MTGVRTGVFPGTFDPFTNGHLDLTRRAARLFDRVVVAVAHSPGKGTLFPVGERVEMIRAATATLRRVEVVEPPGRGSRGAAAPFGARPAAVSAVLEGIRRMARARTQRLMFAEAGDDRVVRAAERLSRDRLAQVSLIGAREALRSTARRCDVSLTGVECIDPGDPAEVERAARALKEARGER